MILYLNSFEGGPTTDFFNYFRFSSRIYLHKQQQKEEGRNSSSGIFIITPGWWSRKSWSLAAATLINWSTLTPNYSTHEEEGESKTELRTNSPAYQLISARKVSFRSDMLTSGVLRLLLSQMTAGRWAAGPHRETRTGTSYTAINRWYRRFQSWEGEMIQELMKPLPVQKYISNLCPGSGFI